MDLKNTKMKTRHERDLQIYPYYFEAQTSVTINDLFIDRQK